MTDYFDLLQEPRAPWLESESLKRKFLALSAALHPDRSHAAGDAEQAAASRRFAELNAAYQCLREPKERLGHLLELELSAAPKDAKDVPADAMDLFFEVGRVCRETDAFLAAKTKTTSPLVKAGMFAAGIDLTNRLTGLQQRIQAQRDALLGELKRINTAWETAPAAGNPGRAAALPLESLEQAHRMLSYMGRWSGQIQERLLQLSF